MADFSRPEYASYWEFAREVAIPRIPQNGDYFAQFGYPRKPIVKGPVLLPMWKVGPWPDVTEYGFSDYWLPTLGDWLKMLKETGVAGVDFHFEPPSASIHHYGKHAATERELALLTRLHEAKPSSLEEAAARLYVAVTQTPADPSPPSAAR